MIVVIPIDQQQEEDCSEEQPARHLSECQGQGLKNEARSF
jgi:hypothetical protein